MTPWSSPNLAVAQKVAPDAIVVSSDGGPAAICYMA